MQFLIIGTAIVTLIGTYFFSSFSANFDRTATSPSAPEAPVKIAPTSTSPRVVTSTPKTVPASTVRTPTSLFKGPTENPPNY